MDKEQIEAGISKLTTFVVERGRQQGKEIRPRSASQLARVASRLILIQLSRKNIRPAELAKVMPKLSKALRTSAAYLEQVGAVGMLYILSEDPTPTPEETDPLPDIERIFLLAELTQRACITANAAKAATDTKRGPTRDFRLKPLAQTLILNFEKYTELNATHTKDNNTWFATSFFDEFFKEALRLFAPADFEFKPRAIEDAIGDANADLKRA